MKNGARLPIIILLAAWIFARGLNGQSNETVSLALPPKDWNMSEHALFGLIVTNDPGDYPLHGSWVGVEKTTVRTGWYATQFEIASETDRLIRLAHAATSSRVGMPIGLPSLLSSRYH